MTDQPPAQSEPENQATPVNSLEARFLAHKGNMSDKWEHYLAIYEIEIKPYVESKRPLRLFEIGVQNGGSLEIWRDYLPAGSSVVGLDIDPACAKLELGDDIRVLIGDAGDPAAIDQLLGTEVFDIVVDDGSHRSDHIISTFRSCWERVAPGGLFIVEDLHCSYFASHGGGFRKPEAAIEYFKTLVDALNAEYFEVDAADKENAAELERLRTLGSQVSRVSFYDSVIVVQRALEPRAAPYRRVMTGLAAPVADPASAVPQLPVAQLRSLLLSSAAAQAFEPALRASVLAARETVEAQRETIAAQRDAIAAEPALRANITAARETVDAQRETIASQREAIAALREAKESAVDEANSARARATQAEAEAQARVASAEAKAQARVASAEAEAQVIASSTLWRATRPLRSAMQAAPLWARVFARRAARGTWWTVTGQLPARLRARAAAKTEQPLLLDVSQPQVAVPHGMRAAPKTELPLMLDVSQPDVARSQRFPDLAPLPVFPTLLIATEN